MPEREKEIVFIPPAPGSAMDKYIQKKVEEAAMAAATAVVRNQVTPSAILDTVEPWIPNELRSVGYTTNVQAGASVLQLPNEWSTAVWGPGMPNTTGKTQYMVYQITDDETTPPTAGFDWVRAHA